MEEQIQQTDAPQVEQPEVQESSPGLQFFDNVDDLAASFNDAPQQEEVVETAPEQQQETPYVDPEAAPTTYNDETISDDEAERMMLEFMGEKL